MKKGQTNNPNGRPKGVPNKFTATAREAFDIAFNGVGGSDGLTAWAKANRTEFYRIYSRLIPVASREEMQERQFVFEIGGHKPIERKIEKIEMVVCHRTIDEVRKARAEQKEREQLEKQN